MSISTCHANIPICIVISTKQQHLRHLASSSQNDKNGIKLTIQIHPKYSNISPLIIYHSLDQTLALAPSAKKHCQGSPKAARGAAKAPKIGQGIPKPGGGFEQISSWKSTIKSRYPWLPDFIPKPVRLGLGKILRERPHEVPIIGSVSGTIYRKPWCLPLISYVLFHIDLPLVSTLWSHGQFGTLSIARKETPQKIIAAIVLMLHCHGGENNVKDFPMFLFQFSKKTKTFGCRGNWRVHEKAPLGRHPIDGHANRHVDV